MQRKLARIILLQNCVCFMSDIRRACKLYKSFSGHIPEIVGSVQLGTIPKALVIVGELDGILYSTVRDGANEKYIHRFHKRDRPYLAVSPDGKSLHIIGGDYEFNLRGIVDKSDKRL